MLVVELRARTSDFQPFHERQTRTSFDAALTSVRPSRSSCESTYFDHTVFEVVKILAAKRLDQKVLKRNSPSDVKPQRQHSGLTP